MCKRIEFSISSTLASFFSSEVSWFPLFFTQYGCILIIYSLTQSLLICTFPPGDIESNPGPFPQPFWKKDEEIVENLQKIIDDQEDEIADLKDLVDKQGDTIHVLTEKIEKLVSKSEELKADSEQNSDEIRKVQQKLEEEKNISGKLCLLLSY